MNALSVSQDPGLEGIKPRNDPEEYLSMALELFDEEMQKESETKVLDVGPVCGENIDFWAQRVSRLYVCDLFLRLMRDRGQGLPVSGLWRHLDYQPDLFHGLLLWDLADHMEDEQVSRLVEICLQVIKPGGLLIVFAMGRKAMSPGVYSFALGRDFKVRPRLQSHLDLPLVMRQNREILALMEPFMPVKSFRYRNGFREFLFRKPLGQGYLSGNY